MVLVKRGLEGRATSTRAGCLLASTCTDCRTAHEISSLIVVLGSLASMDPPANNGKGTDDDCTTHTDDDTDDDLLLRGRETRAAVRVIRRSAAQTRVARGFRTGGSRRSGESGLDGGSADGLDGRDRLHDRGCGGLLSSAFDGGLAVLVCCSDCSCLRIVVVVIG